VTATATAPRLVDVELHGSLAAATTAPAPVVVAAVVVYGILNGIVQTHTDQLEEEDGIKGVEVGLCSLNQVDA
jgi:hypothetical protein